MAEETKEQQEEKKGGKKKLILILLILLILLGGGGAAAYKFLVLDKKKEEQKEKKAEKVVEEIKNVEDLGVQFDVGTFIVNLQDKDADRYLKISIVLDVQDEKIKAELDKRLPQVKDAITTLLFTKSSSELRTAEGIEELKEEILKRVNAILPIGGVKNVYFTDFVIQTA
ncbi:flagellar FliL protein [Nitratiruptor sp. YY08-26]|uniref:flagellar basal body-associated FliL family protein n=1 Tax=unclassified Nitratiruptor TaxID=2624044 RepID=UPI00191509B7|nr:MULTISPECIES: flagellar basal body-associated FliL family protein [unclassified Nitratiruptor]BCD61868.1 flagellar FliL protein [Nitratiruptor sp. YY08-13]BCD65803.1 flagellar FliL protein [Nitratiruptor sp. YY08-26]